MDVIAIILLPETLMHVPWYVIALGAALVWGVHYPLVGFALQRISLFSLILITVLPVILLVPFFAGQLHSDVHNFCALPASEQWMISLTGLTSLAGTAFVFLAISNKTPTLASLIEITYPIFVALFSYLIFRQVQINLSIVLGGLLVISGASLIIINNQ